MIDRLLGRTTKPAREEEMPPFPTIWPVHIVEDWGGDGPTLCGRSKEWRKAHEPNGGSVPVSYPSTIAWRDTAEEMMYRDQRILRVATCPACREFYARRRSAGWQSPSAWAPSSKEK